MIAVAASAVMLLTLDSSFNFMLNEIARDLDATSFQTTLLRQVPAVAALLVIFLAGTLGARLGERRVMVSCAGLYTLGSLVVVVSPAIVTVTLGVLLADTGRSVLIVVGLALISSEVTGKNGRATAFAAFSAALPVTFLVMPLVAGLLLEHASWRWVAIVWALSGVVALVTLRALLPTRSTKTGQRGELITPALAGLVLAASVQVITVLPNQGMTARVWLTLAVATAAALALGVTMKRLRQPTFTLAPLRGGGMVLLLVVLVLTMFANLWFYMTMGLQYIFGLDAMGAALVTVPAQMFSVIGSGLAGAFINRRGMAVTGTALLIVVATALFATTLIQLDTPIWVSVLMLSVYSAAAVGASVTLTNAVMDLAPKGQEGSVSAYRGAALNLGSAVGVAGMTTIVFLAVSGSLQQQYVSAGLDPDSSSQVAAEVRQGTAPEDVASQYAVPAQEVAEISAMQTQAFLDGLHAHGIVGSAVTLIAAGAFFAVRRWQESAA